MGFPWVVVLQTVANPARLVTLKNRNNFVLAHFCDVLIVSEPTTKPGDL
jgi:hypothetical protein